MPIAIDSHAPVGAARECPKLPEGELRAMPPSHSLAVGASNEDIVGGSGALRSHDE